MPSGNLVPECNPKPRHLATAYSRESRPGVQRWRINSRSHASSGLALGVRPQSICQTENNRAIITHRIQRSTNCAKKAMNSEYTLLQATPSTPRVGCCIVVRNIAGSLWTSQTNNRPRWSPAQNKQKRLIHLALGPPVERPILVGESSPKNR